MMQGIRPLKALVAAAVLAFVAAPTFAQVEVDPNLPTYQPTSGVSGSVKFVGSDTMNNMATMWCEEFYEMYPNVSPEVEGKGSSTAPPAMISGAATFGPMSRQMKDKEQEAFEGAFGYKATQFPTAIDMLAVFINKDNPVDQLTLPEVDAIFSSTRKLGHGEDITNWSQVDGPNMPISLYGRNSVSGTYGVFKKIALGGGDYKGDVKEQPGSSAVVQSVGNDKGGIGYSGIGYNTPDVKAVAIAKDAQSPYIKPIAKNAYTGEYPLARFLYLSVNHKPGSKLDPLRREFLKFVFSKQGMEIVKRDGYFPVSAQMAKRALKSVNISVDHFPGE
jgi:phosphate transport system substrate-binding protein